MDIDIDLKTTFKPKEHFDVVEASMVENDELKKHNAGVYFQTIPIDSITGLSAIPYKNAEDEGYLKIDMLHLSFLNYFESKSEIKILLKKEPNWKLLEKQKIIKKLFQISNHADVVIQVKPTSINDLSDILALIRPYKRHLLDKYLKNKKSIIKELYTKRHPSDMRKSHTVPYAMIIVLQLHLIEAGIL
jgi:DNA polymerase III alpha subunit